MMKRQYNNSVYKIGGYLVSVELKGYTASGKRRYRVGIIDTDNTHYLHEKVYTTTSHEDETTEAARVLDYYKESLTA